MIWAQFHNKKNIKFRFSIHSQLKFLATRLLEFEYLRQSIKDLSKSSFETQAYPDLF